jgi:hypothetical protein
MKEIKHEIKNEAFWYCGEKYDCKTAIEKDIKEIIKEAETTHKTLFNNSYDKTTLKPKEIKLFIDDNAKIIYGMIVYTIYNKEGNYDRLACGNYYPIWNNILMPHPFQASICW